jgi:nicotinamidase-related amidase
MIDPDTAANTGLAAHAASRGIASRLAALASAFRQAGLPVVHSTIEPRDDYVGTEINCLLLGVLAKRRQVIAGLPGAEILPLLTPEPGDIRIRRVHGLTPFHGTELEAYLRQQRVTTVVLAGVSTDIGIPGACLEAVNRGFRVVVVEDGIAGSSPEAHDWQVRHTLPLLASVTSCADVQATLFAAASNAPA